MEALRSSLIAQQESWQRLVDQRDSINLTDFRFVGGLDIQWNSVGKRGVGVLAVVSFPDCHLVHTEVNDTSSDIPWQSGFLGFRECPCYSELVQRVRGTEFEPDIYMIDGFGVLHPRGCGSASQLGVQCGVRTIGVAKSLLQPDCTLNEKQVKDVLDTKQTLMLDLLNPAWQTVGCAVRHSLTARQPVYVSVGHKVSLATACSVVCQCCKHRIPEPIRQADILARHLMRNANMQYQQHCVGTTNCQRSNYSGYS